MEFNPNNNVVKLCLQGMDLEGRHKAEEASSLFLQAWKEATNDFEKYLAAYYVTRHQKNVPDKLKWLETTLQFALKINNESVKAAFPSLYIDISKCYEDLSDLDNAKKYYELANSFTDKPSDKGPFYHGTKADLKVGDLLTAGSRSNYKPGVDVDAEEHQSRLRLGPHVQDSADQPIPLRFAHGPGAPASTQGNPDAALAPARGRLLPEGHAPRVRGAGRARVALNGRLHRAHSLAVTRPKNAWPNTR